MKGISERARSVSASATLAVSSKVKSMRAKGVDIVDLGAGEPDFDTPINVKEAAIDAIRSGFTKYTSTPGILELRQAICDRLIREKGLHYAPDQIVASCGAKHSIFNAIQALVDQGDEVIIPAPYWVSYVEQVKMAGGRPVIADTDEFRLSPSAIEEKVNSKTKLLILNSPCNPTGEVFGREELAEVAEMAVRNEIYVISDEIYDRFVYGVKHCSIASLGEEIRSLTITVNGFSKTYSMTGWRLGYAAGPQDIMSSISRLQDHMTTNPTSIAQKAGLKALTDGEESVVKMVKEFERRRAYVSKRLAEIGGISCRPPNGTFYFFPDVCRLFKDDIKDSNSLAIALLEQAGVAVVPGVAFGDDNHVRISYCTPMESLEEGMNRLQDFARRLQK